MAYALNVPARLAEEINELIRIGDDPLDEFTQRRLLGELEHLKTRGQFDVPEYQAYSKLLFQMGRTDEALAVNREGLSRFNSLPLLSVDAIEKVYLWQQNLRPFDPFSEFFDHSVNPARAALRFYFSSDRFRIGINISPVVIAFERALVGSLQIHPDSGYIANVGPFRIEQDFEDALELRFAVGPLVCIPIFESWAMGRLNDDERSFTNERLGAQGLRAAMDAATEVTMTDLRCRLRLWQVEKNAWVGHSPEFNLATFGISAESAEQRFRETVEHVSQSGSGATAFVRDVKERIHER